MAKSKNYVALLGTKGGPAIRPGSTMPTSSLVSLNGHQMIVDCGLGVSRGLIDQGMQLRDLDTIFITHMHSDHYLELGPLIHTAWTAGLKTKVTIFAPEGIKTYWQAFLNSMKADIDLRIQDEGRPDLQSLVTINILDETKLILKNEVEVCVIRNAHPPLVDTYALSFKSKKHHIVFSGDTAYHEPLVEFAKHADLLIHEAMLEEALYPLMERVGNGDNRLMKHWLRSHTFASDAARIAKKANVKALALHHLIPSDDPDFTVADWERAVKPYWDGKLYLGTDGMRIELDRLTSAPMEKSR